jgi:hypothetical protein
MVFIVPVHGEKINLIKFIILYQGLSGGSVQGVCKIMSENFVGLEM